MTATPFRSAPLQAGGFKHSNASIMLDLLRGVAALVVLLEHWRNLYFVDFGSVRAHRHLLAFFYVLTSAGHQAVVVFFVLSGYLVGGSVIRSHARGQWSWIDYLTHRLVRLWVVLIPGLLLCLLWDKIGIALHTAPAIYDGQLRVGFIGNVASRLSARVWFGNLAFLQGLVVPTFGSDGPLWSIANEFWYYILFPLGVMVFRRRTSLAARLVSVMLLMAIAWPLRMGILFSFPIWLAGAGLSVMRLPQLTTRFRIMVTIAYLPLPFVLAKVHTIPGLWSDYLFGAGTLLFLLVLLGTTGRADDAGLFARISRALARFSYTLYVVHFPLLLLLATLILGDKRWAPYTAHLLTSLGILLVTVLYAWGVAWVTEFRTDRVRRWVECRTRRWRVAI